MNRVILVLVFCTALIPGFSQKSISGRSEPTRISLQPEYKRGLPPNLYADMSFVDANNNNILEANENATLTIVISNLGQGPAQSVTISVKDSTFDPALSIGSDQLIPIIFPDQKIPVTFTLKAGLDIKTGRHKLRISIKEKFGYDMDPAFLYIKTLAFQEPRLVFAGVEIIDAGQGTVAIIEDGKLQPGERVKVKITVQNVGQNISRNTRFIVISKDANIFLDDNEGDVGDLSIGEVKDFYITLSPNKRVSCSGNLPVYLTLTNSSDRGNLTDYQLPIQLDKKPPEPTVLIVNTDFDKLNREITRFAVSPSSKIKTNIGNLINIRQVPPSKSKMTNAVAVVIGIEKYDHFVSAPYAENDAMIMQQYFKNVLGVETVYLYKSKDATGFFFDNIFDPVYGDLQKAIEKGKTDLFVYYSGHGIPSKDGTKVYLLPADGRPESVERQGFELNKLYANLKALGAASTTVFMDACFSGASKASENHTAENLVSMKGVLIKPSIVQPWESDPHFSLFSSSGVGETSLSFDQSETGLFTYFLCAGLQGKAMTDGETKVTAGKLATYLINMVKDVSVKISGLQVPQFHGNENLILVEY
jgi:glycosyltransferase involved in cell wall biosynthesis